MTKRCIGMVAVVMLFFLTVPLPALSSDMNGSGDITVKIGILAKRGPEQCMAQWSPTAAYLAARIPGKIFEIAPLDFDQIHSVVEKGNVDFILANPSFYVQLEHDFGVNRIVTLKNRRFNGVYVKMGGVIFCKAGRKDIRQMTDLAGKTFMAVDEFSFGGWQMAWRELHEKGIDPYQDFASLEFGGTHDAVVYAVCNGSVDAGTVRTEILERMQAEGKINLDDFYVIHEHGGGKVHLPFMHSTREYPEWPFARVKHVSDEFAEKVAIALLDMPENSPAAIAAHCAGWTVPLNYKSVRECLKELKIDPYAHFEKITLPNIIRHYWHAPLITFLLSCALVVFLIISLRLVRKVTFFKVRLRAEHEERGVAEQALAESYRIINSSPVVAFLWKNEEGWPVEFVTENVSELLGYTDKEFYSGTVSYGNVIHPDDRKWVSEEIVYFSSNDAVTRFSHAPYRIIDKKGVVKWVDDRSLIRRDKNGKITHYQGIVIDITNQKETEDAFIAARKEAETANRAKSDFLTSMSHEIRTPMTAVIGMIDLLFETPLNDEQKRLLGVVRSSGETLSQLVNDILDLSRVEAGLLDIGNAPFNLLEVLKNACDAQALSAHEKNLELVWHAAPGIGTYLVGDPIRLGQILTNLIANAIKFTETGEVFVKVEMQEGLKQTLKKGTDSGGVPDTVKTAELLFSVIDTGIGVPKEKQEIIFDRFTQADASTTRQYGGTGLGLTISRLLAGLMGGRMWVESGIGRGSTFYFTARLDVQPGKTTDPAPEADINGVKVLVIDDNTTNRMVLTGMFSRWDAIVNGKKDGLSGLDEMKQAADAKEPYGLIIVDAQMPVMDGFQVAEAIKNDPGLSSPVVMMLTTEDRERSIEKIRSLGLDNFLVKPVKWSDLKETVLKALGRKSIIDREPSPEPVPAMTEDLRPLHILIAEDNDKNLMLVKAFLKKTPYVLDVAENGEIALEKFKIGKYDLVLMDIQMPVMDGYAATVKIREWESQNRKTATPIVALSAHALEEQKKKSIASGCNAHLTKPIKKPILLDAIKKYGNGRKGTD